MASNNYASPYGKPAPQYPSQSEDYISLEFGGLGPTPKEDSQQNNRKQWNHSTPAKYSGNSPNLFSQNRRGGQNRSGGGPNPFHGTNNKRHTHAGFGLGYQPNHQQQNKWSPNSRGAGNYGGSGTFQQRGGGGGHFKNKNFGKNEFDFNSYYHPTMLEDPWHDLIERHNALRKSEINFESTMQQDSSNSDSANESEQKKGD